MRKLFSLIAAVLFAGSMMAADATMTAGTNGSACTVNGVDGIKCGTSKAGGDMTITVGAGATKLSFYAAAWKGVTGLSLNLAADGVTISPASVSLTADDGISNNSPFTLAGLPENFKFEVDLSDVSAETVISVTSSAAKRFAVWGASYETGEGGGDVPPVEPTPDYFLVGSNNGWDGTGYQFAENPGAEGEYMLDVTFAAADEFKVIGVLDGDTTWFPDGIDNNYVISEAGEYVVYFRPDGQGGEDWHYGVIYAAKKEAPIVHQYEVAEAIAAGLADDTEIMVRGIVTKMEFKGTNFAKYGSVNIYVADATGAEGEFEFYNCYSFNADTFRVSSPEYDAESTAWAEFEMVADENGNEIHLGDTVIAFGKYKLYKGVHELNQGCNIVDVKHAAFVPGEEVIIDVEYAEAAFIPAGVDEETQEPYDAVWQFNLYKDYNAETKELTYPDMYIFVAPKSETAIAGTYSAEKDLYMIKIDLNKETAVYAEGASDLVVTYLGEGVYHYELEFLGDDNNIYILDVKLETVAWNAETYEEIELTDEEPQAVANVTVDNKAVKAIVRGQLIIKKNGAEYNAAGQLLK